MSTFVLIHGAADSGWAWHLVEAELRARGHDTVAPDLPCDDDSAGLDAYVAAVEAAVGDRGDLVVVGHSLGGFTATLLASRRPVDLLVLAAAMVPAPGEKLGDWWANTGYSQAAEEQAARDGGLTGNEDEYVGFYHDVPRELADESLRRARNQSGRVMQEVWPLETWPDVPTRFIVFTEDRFFPAEFLRKVARDRIGVEADGIDGGHCAMLSRPRELAALLDSYVGGSRS